MPLSEAHIFLLPFEWALAFPWQFFLGLPLQAHLLAMKQLRHSKAMADVLTATLALGNFLNYGTRLGATAGGGLGVWGVWGEPLTIPLPSP